MVLIKSASNNLRAWFYVRDFITFSLLTVFSR